MHWEDEQTRDRKQPKVTFFAPKLLTSKVKTGDVGSENPALAFVLCKMAGGLCFPKQVSSPRHKTTPSGLTRDNVNYWVPSDTCLASRAESVDSVNQRHLDNHNDKTQATDFLTFVLHNPRQQQLIEPLIQFGSASQKKTGLCVPTTNNKKPDRYSWQLGYRLSHRCIYSCPRLPSIDPSDPTDPGDNKKG